MKKPTNKWKIINVKTIHDCKYHKIDFCDYKKKKKRVEGKGKWAMKNSE